MKQINKFYSISLVIGLLCLNLLFCANAFAAPKNACSGDIEKFCKNIKPGSTAMIGCLEAHENELSAECKAYEAKMEGRREEAMEQAKIVIKFRQDCKADISQFCRGVDSAKGGTLKCINDHKSDLSTKCSQWLKALNQE
jgi:hypothetical protein